MLNGTLEEAIETLAGRAADLRTRPATFAEKRAAGMSDYLGSFGSAMQNNPTLASTLLGGGVGAGLGGLHAAVTNRRKDPAERRSVLGSALTGGLAGGAVGGGAGLAYQGAKSLRAAPGLGHGPTAQRGEFTDPATGQRMVIDPQALKNDPDLLSKLKGLRQPQDPIKMTARGVMGTVGAGLARAVPGATNLLEETGLKDGNTQVEDKLPVSSWLLPKLGLTDAALHAPGLNLGERLGIGRIRPQFSQNKEHLIKGVAEVGEKLNIPKVVREHIVSDTGGLAGRVGGSTGIKPSGTQSLAARGLNRLTTKTKSSPQPTVAKALDRLFGHAGPGDESVGSVTHRPMNVEKIRDHIDPANPASGFKERDVPEPGKEKTEHITRTQGQMAKREGYIANTKAEGYAKPPGLFRVGSKEFKMPTGRAGLIGRGLVYGGIPAAEYALNSYNEGLSDQNQVRQLMTQHAKPAK